MKEYNVTDVKNTGIEKVVFNTVRTLIAEDDHQIKKCIEVTVDTLADTANVSVYEYKDDTKEPENKETKLVRVNDIEKAFKTINEMLPKINSHVDRLDDTSIVMTVTYEDGKEVKVDRGDLVDGESIVYQVMEILDL